MVPFIDRVIEGGTDAVTAPDDALSVRDYLDLMLAGSFPEPSLRIPVTARRRWFVGYVEQMITRDVPAVAPPPGPGAAAPLPVRPGSQYRRHRC
jgi:hypothetical protein